MFFNKNFTMLLYDNIKEWHLIFILQLWYLALNSKKEFIIITAVNLALNSKKGFIIITILILVENSTYKKYFKLYIILKLQPSFKLNIIKLNKYFKFHKHWALWLLVSLKLFWPTFSLNTWRVLMFIIIRSPGKVIFLTIHRFELK